MNDNKAAVYIHRLYFNGQIKKGGLDQILDILLAKNFELILFEFPLDYSQTHSVRVSKVNKNFSTTLVKFEMPQMDMALNWIAEFFVTIYLSLKYVKNTNLVLTSDPLTTLAPIILKYIGYFKFIYYHSIDYSTDRFSNPVLNKIYNYLLKVGLSHADLVGVVTRTAEKRLLPIRGKKKIVYIPNSPAYEALEPFRIPTQFRIKHSLVVTCAGISHKFMIHKIVELVASLHQYYSDILINIIGHYEEKDPYFINIQNYIEKNSLKNNVNFLGNLDRETNYKIIGKSLIGLAFYDGEFSHVFFGDALKIREYSALGLAIVADKHTSTAIEMAERGCGVAVDNFEYAIIQVKAIFEDTQLMEKFAKNSLIWAKDNDKDKIFTEIIQNEFKIEL